MRLTLRDYYSFLVSWSTLLYSNNIKLVFLPILSSSSSLSTIFPLILLFCPYCCNHCIITTEPFIEKEEEYQRSSVITIPFGNLVMELPLVFLFLYYIRLLTLKTSFCLVSVPLLKSFQNAKTVEIKF